MADRGAIALPVLQRRLLELFRAPDGFEQGLARLGIAAEDVEALVVGDHRLDARGRVGIYADMYFLRLVEVLRDAFPRLARALGDDFGPVTAAYLDGNPSQHPSLRFLGARFPAFLRSPDAARFALAPWAADLAALEWQRYDVFDEADAAPLTRHRVVALTGEALADLPVRLAPATRLLETQWAVETAWREIDRGEPAAPEKIPGRLLIWRQETFVYHRPLDPLEAQLLRSAAAGTTFSVCCAEIATALEGSPQDPAQTAFRLLARWIDDAVLVAPAPEAQ